MRPTTRGFTLIELSIVLVIIGLIVGGVLVGRDLIEAAALRATISQIEKYNTAAHTFEAKYDCIPGDCAKGGNFGFPARGTRAGEGDGNGLIEGSAWFTGTPNGGLWESAGETAVFWVDLSEAGLIEGSFNTASETSFPPISSLTLSSTPGLNNYVPQAKIGRGNYFYVWSGGYGGGGHGTPDRNNYFGLSAIEWIYNAGSMVSNQALTVQEAYNIDTKMDDGFPQSGAVTALYLCDNGNYVNWASGDSCTDNGAHGVDNIPITDATPYAPINCYDNNGVTGPQTYSMTQNASVVNCALSFRFQ